MISLNAEEAQYLLELLAREHGSGYAAGPVGQLQAKLSVMCEVAVRVGNRSEEPFPQVERTSR